MHKNLIPPAAVFPDQMDANVHPADFLTRHAVPTSTEDFVAWHRASDFAAETGYAFPTIASLFNEASGTSDDLGTKTATCKTEDFPPAANRQYGLYMLNHFVSTPVANVAKTEIANGWALLRRRAVECETVWNGHAVNFVVVDFWSKGDVVGVSLYLNLDSGNRALVEGSAPGAVSLRADIAEMIKSGTG